MHVVGRRTLGHVLAKVPVVGDAVDEVHRVPVSGDVGELGHAQHLVDEGVLVLVAQDLEQLVAWEELNIENAHRKG